MPRRPSLGVARAWVRRQRLPWLLLIAGLLGSGEAMALGCQSNASGAWSAVASWTACGGVAPKTGDTVTIGSVHTIALDVDSAVIASLTVNSGATLTLTSTAKNLYLGGDLVNNGTIDFQIGSSGVNTIYLAGSNLASTFSGTGTWRLDSLDMRGTSGANKCNGACRVELSGSPYLRFYGATPISSNSTFTFNAGGNASATVDLNLSGNQSIAVTGVVYPNLVLSGSGVKTPPASTLTVLGGLTVASGVTINAGSRTLSVAGALLNSGTYTATTGSLTIGGDLTSTGTFTPGTGTYTFNGSTAQHLAGPTAFANLALNNPAGLTLTQTTTISNVLTLASGALTTSGAGVEIVAGASCLTSVSRTGGWVAGTLRKTIPTGSPTCSFELGDSTTYRPITGVAFASVTTSFTISASVSQSAGKHPSILSSQLNPSRGVNRYWTMTNNGAGSPFTTYSAVFNFVSSDLDPGTSTGSLLVSKLSGLSWSQPSIGTRTATSIQIVGVAAFGDFAVGEAAVAGPDHYELSLPTSSINCLPTTVTVAACTNSSSPCTSAYSAASGTTAALSTSGATLGAGTVTFNASGVATTTLSYAAATNGAAVSVTLSGEQTAATNARRCCPNGTSCSAANSCSTTFNTAGLIIATSAGGTAATLPTQTAGTASSNYYLRAVQSSTTTAACSAALTGAATVNWAYQCNNPTTCSASNLMSLNGGAATTIARNDNGSVASTTPVAMTFDASGNAPFSFTLADVGQVTLWASKAVNAAPLAGSSNAFVARPAGFAVSGIAQTASPFLANPAAAGAGGAKFVRAGESFGATVTARTSSGAATPNYGREISPEGVVLSPALVMPVGGVTGVLSNATVAGGSFSGGVASVTNLAWDEVGIIGLTPSVADADYLGTGNVTGTATGNVGRFIPDHFSVTQGTPAPACSSAFSYFGQDGFTTPFTLKAENAANATTRNYTGSFALLGLTSWSNFVFSSASLPIGSAMTASAMAPSGSWSLGVASVSARHQVSRPAALTGETSIIVKAAPLDSDGVTMTAAQLGAGTPLRFGRLRLSNAFGSEKTALQMTVQAQYWSGNAWAPNGADSCSVVAAAAVVRSGYLDNKGAATVAWSTTPGAISVIGGSGTLTLSAPSPAATGSVDLALNLGVATTDQSCLATHPASTGAALPWLRAQQGSCSTAWDRDPAARASFGIYAPETRKTLHVREVF